MLNENTRVKLRKMALSQMDEEYERQLRDEVALNLSFDERFGMIIDSEYARRNNNRLKRLIKSAGFSDTTACVENISYDIERKLNASLIQTLASCTFIEDKRNLCILGPTGAGKSFLATAFGIAACRKSFTVKYTGLQDMLIELAAAKMAGIFNKTLAVYNTVKLLILDDWLMFDIMDDGEASILYNLIEKRKYVGSIIVCSQIDAKGWHSKISNKIAADSICDRLVNSSYKIIVEGEMRRKLAAPIFAEA
ncbi:MAG: ATP-binding protein [Peptococcaceae bacterium]|nr:ATP-binding protein [Peptococcaceae bacterium]